MDGPSNVIPCPFCGSRQVSYGYNSVDCTNCHCEGPLGSQEESVTKWNTRASYATPDGDLEHAIERLTAWLRDFGDRKTKAFTDDIAMVVEAAKKHHGGYNSNGGDNKDDSSM